MSAQSLLIEFIKQTQKYKIKCLKYLLHEELLPPLLFALQATISCNAKCIKANDRTMFAY